MSFVITYLYPAVAFVLVLGILILVHEMGHYLAGRALGFGIEAFSIGFGPKIFEIKGKHNLWQFRWILAGGYVKFKGELGEEDEEAGTPADQLFYNKARWRRFLVMVMGVTFNVILAFFMFSGLAFHGIAEPVSYNQPPVVGIVAPGSPAAKAGIQVGDRILSLDGRQVKTWNEAQNNIAMLMNRPYAVKLLRDGKTMAVTVHPQTIKFLHQPMGSIGVAPVYPLVVVNRVQKGSPAAAAGLKPGDRFVMVNGEAIKDERQVALAVEKAGAKPVNFTMERDKKKFSVTIKPRWDEKAKRYFVGVEMIPAMDETLVRYPIPSCFGKALHIMEDQTVLVYRAIKGMFQKRVPVNALAGPVSIAYVAGKIAQTGLFHLLFFMALLSFWLALANVLPIPGLDGGQIFILAIEGLIRRDLPMPVKERILQIGFLIIILLFGAIFIMDVAKFIP
ncbi:MAG: RIP metalloprotease RseP [Acidobacteriota bacterium]